jgi:hypothetical protein
MPMPSRNGVVQSVLPTITGTNRGKKKFTLTRCSSLGMELQKREERTVLSSERGEEKLLNTESG